MRHDLVSNLIDRNFNLFLVINEIRLVMIGAVFILTDFSVIVSAKIAAYTLTHWHTDTPGCVHAGVEVSSSRVGVNLIMESLTFSLRSAIQPKIDTHRHTDTPKLTHLKMLDDSVEILWRFFQDA